MRLFHRAAAIVIAVIILSLQTALCAGAAFSGADKINIVLDAGHGGHDPGSAGINAEAYYNLKVAQYTRDALVANGNFNVYMTRDSADKYLTLAERMYYADSENADIAISIHFNSSTSSSLGGIEVYGSVLDHFYAGELGSSIGSKLSAATGLKNCGIFRKQDYGKTLYYWSSEYQWDIPGESSLGVLSDYYGIITWAAKFGFPSLIVEHAYLSNPSERTLVEQDSVLRAMGEADAAAIIEYYTNHTHSYGGTVADAPVTCFSAGKQSEHCSICGHRRNVRQIASAPDPSKHLWLAEEGSVAATCESDGYANYVCRYTSNLNDKGCTQFQVHRSETAIPALGHDYAVTYQRDVTHTVDGIVTYTCSRCGSSYSETTPAEGHSYVPVAHADPDCTNAGYDTYRCSVCGDEYSDAIPANGHTFDILSHTDPECERDGSESRRCTVCGFEETVTLPATGHTLQITVERAATCTEAGFTDSVCSVCGKAEHTELSPTEHSFSVTAETPATCEGAGERRQVCTVCGFEETVLLSPIGHDTEILSETPATCESAGVRYEKCRICGKEIDEDIPATGHDWQESRTIKAPGLIFDGKAEYVCKNDSAHVETRALRDLTIFEYRTLHPMRFTLMCAAAGIVICAAAAAIVIIVRKRSGKSPFHAKNHRKAADAPAHAEPAAVATEPEPEEAKK